MRPGQLVAALAAVLIVGSLVAVRVSRSDELGPTVAAAAEGAGATDRASATTLGSTTLPSTETAAADAPAADAPEHLGPAGDLEQLDGWLQTDAPSFDAFDGQVRIVQFWTFGCFNCRNTIPHLQGIYERWQPEGLEIIGVHAPEFDFERDPDAIAAAAVDHGVTWPIALDTEKRNFRSWQPGRRFWPRTFVIDQKGEIRFDHIGEGRYDELEAAVAYLVENGP